MRYGALILLFIFVAWPAFPLHAGTRDTVDTTPGGLFFSAVYLPGLVFSPSGEQGATTEAGMGVGYLFPCGVAPWMTFLTGHHDLAGTIDAAPDHLAYGGANLGITIHLLRQSGLHPVLGLGVAAATLLDPAGTGYNQNGFRVSAGGMLPLSRYFGLTASLVYGKDYRTRWIGGVPLWSGQVAKEARIAAFSLSFSFYPQIYP